MEQKTKDGIIAAGIDDFIGALVIESVQSPVFSRVSRSVLHAGASRWAGESAVKRTIAGITERVITRLFLSPAGAAVPGLLDDAGSMKMMSELLPSLINGSMEMMLRLAATAGTLPAGERTGYIAGMIRRIDTKQAGRLFTHGARWINELARTNPEIFAEALRDPVKNLLASADVGEFREMVEGFGDVLIPVIRTVNDELWNYPAKVVNVFGCVPPVVNGAAGILGEVVRPLNNMTPEILADVLFSLLRSLNGKEIGSLFNAAMELGRKMHTGSLLLAESERSRFSEESGALLRDVFAVVDPRLFAGFHAALSEAAETVVTSYADALSREPAMYAAYVSSYSGRQNPKIRSMRQKLGMFENVPEQEAADAVERGLADLDTREIGEIINTLIRYINLLRKQKPGMLPHVISDIVLTIDTDELKSAADGMIGDIVNACKPALRAVLPSLVQGLILLLSPDHGEEPEDLNNALASLVKVFLRRTES